MRCREVVFDGGKKQWYAIDGEPIAIGDLIFFEGHYTGVVIRVMNIHRVGQLPYQEWRTAGFGMGAGPADLVLPSAPLPA